MYALTTSPTTPTSDELGVWTCSFDIPDLPDATGVYDIQATDETGNTTTADYDIGASITLSDDEGPEGMVITVSGRGFGAAETIDTDDITIDGQHMTVTEDDVVSGTDDSFSIEVVIPSLGEGTYTITVDDGTGNTAGEDFEIVGAAEIDVTPTYGVAGTTITIEGFNFTQISGETVSIELWNEAGDTAVVDIEEVDTDSNGEFDEEIVIPAQNNGKYTIFAIDTVNKVNASTDFKIGSIIVILSKDSGPSGLEVILTGTGFEVGSDWNATMGGELVIEDGATVDVDGNLEENAAVPKFYVPSIEPGVYTILIMDDTGNEVEVDFEVTDTTSLETDPLVAPQATSTNQYNVSVLGMYFSQDEGADLEFVLYNVTGTGEVDMDWDMDVRQGEDGVSDVAATIQDTDDNGDFEAWWEVLEDLSIGSYIINCTDEYGLFAQYHLDIVSKTVGIDARKSVFMIGDTVAFNIDSSYAQLGSYIKIMDPSGNLYWQTNEFDADVWVKVGTIQRVPFYEQVAGGNPMTLLDDAPLGTWTWVWYDLDDDELDSGSFTVEAAAADVVGQQVADLNNQITDLADQLNDVTSEFDDVKSDIADVAAIAEQAVAAAQQAAEAVETVAQTANTAGQAAADAAEAANAARDAANGLTTLVYGAIGAALVAALAAIVSLMQISRRIAG
jgi:hypothetical protein